MPADAAACFWPSLALARIVLQFGRVQRATQDELYGNETDTTHTVMLALLAASLAPLEAVPLHAERVLRFALVHDLVEVYAGDTNTTRALTPEQAVEKWRNEMRAFGRLSAELGYTGSVHGWILEAITDYEEQKEPEACFVRCLDKLLPRLTHLINGGSALRVQGVTRAEMVERHIRHSAELQDRYPQFTNLLSLFKAVDVACEGPKGLRLEGE